MAIGSAQIHVDAARRLGRLPRPWTSFGYDELNWTYTPRGRRALAAFASFAERPYYVRAHNLLTSGRGFSWPHWGSGNLYHEDAAGNPVYDWTIADRVFDAYVEVGFKPIVELGFTPQALVPRGAELPYTSSPSQYGRYEAGLWSFPPRDNRRWEQLVYRLAQHCVERYGAEDVATWYWEVWNEPDIFYWRGTPADYCALYDHTAAGLRRALPGIQVGGPAVTGGAGGVEFLRGFLAHCAGEGDLATNVATGARGAPLDFISFHTKGSAFERRFGPLSDDGAVPDWGGDAARHGRVETPRQSPSRRKMLTEIRAHMEAAAQFPQFRSLPCFVDECDPCVPAHLNRYDNSNFGFRTTAYYPAIMASVFKRLMDLNESLPGAPGVALATAWAFLFEGEGFFDGFREFFTAENVELPLLNGYRLLARLGGTRLALSSDATWDVRRVDELTSDDGAAGTLPDAEVDGLAAVDETTGAITVALWHHEDDQYAAAPPADVTVELRNLPTQTEHLHLEHHRVDATHSNAYAVWQALGHPWDPTGAQLRTLRERQGLEHGEALHGEPLGHDGLRIRLQLPLHALSLLAIRGRE